MSNINVMKMGRFITCEGGGVPQPCTPTDYHCITIESQKTNIVETDSGHTVYTKDYGTLILEHDVDVEVSREAKKTIIKERR